MSITDPPGSKELPPGSKELPRSGPTPPPDLPHGEEKTAAVRGMFDSIAPRYDLVNRVMTGGLDLYWRRRAVRALGLPQGSRVLDLACGTGDLLTILDRAGMACFGLDLSSGMLAAGQSSIPVVLADASLLPLHDGSVDGVTCGYGLRNFTDLGAVFVELGRIVRPGGRLSLLEVAEPERGLLLAGHQVWFHRVVPAIGGLLSDREAYRYLPRSTSYLPPTGELRSLLAASGFSTVNRLLLSGGLSQLLTATRRGLP